MNCIRTRALKEFRVPGFTLVELMIVIAVLAILLALAAPSFERSIATNRMSGQANQLLLAMQLARTEALKRRQPVAVCSSANETSCGGTWAQGWIVVTDDNQAGDSSVDIEDVLRVWEGLRGNLTFDDVGSLPGFVRFLPDGRADAAAGTFPIEFLVQLPGCRFDIGREVDITATGRANVREVDC